MIEIPTQVPSRHIIKSRKTRNSPVRQAEEPFPAITPKHCFRTAFHTCPSHSTPAVSLAQPLLVFSGRHPISHQLNLPVLNLVSPLPTLMLNLSTRILTTLSPPIISFNALTLHGALHTTTLGLLLIIQQFFLANGPHEPLRKIFCLQQHGTYSSVYTRLSNLERHLLFTQPNAFHPPYGLPSISYPTSIIYRPRLLKEAPCNKGATALKHDF